MTFAQLPLDSRLHKALDTLGLHRPTAVQLEAVPAALAGRDLLVSAATGSGKTAAYLLPVLQRLLDHAAPPGGTRALVLSPTRELARQVLKQARQLSAFTSLQCNVIAGGADFKYQRALLRKDPELLVATPGRLLEHIQRHSADLGGLEVLVIDEADRMLDMGFAEAVLAIVQASATQRQTLLFSATLAGGKIARIAASVLRNPSAIELNSARDRHADIRQQVLLADNRRHKDQVLNWLLSHEQFDKALVFTNTKTQASRLRGLLAYHRHRIGALHGDMPQEERNRVMDRFRRGHIDVLVATDIAARGLDIKGVDLVINYDMARSGDDYIHRIGRTGRAGDKGLAISLVQAGEWNLKAMIERYLRQTFEPREIAALKASYRGPKKLKTSGKSAASGKRPQQRKAAVTKSKQRHRDRKNIGKRRAPSRTTPAVDLGDGLAPLKKH